MAYQKQTGFSLVEILVTLALLGVLAVFTIPKVLSAFQGSAEDTSRRNVQQVASMLQSAYAKYRQEHNPNAETRFADFVENMNYVRIETTGSLDQHNPNAGLVTCGVNSPCLVFQNGAKMLWFKGTGALNSGNEFGGTDDSRYLYFMIDPDGVGENSLAYSDSTSKTVLMDLYYNGKINTWGHCKAGDLTTNNNADVNWCPGTPASDADWFNWDSK